MFITKSFAPIPVNLKGKERSAQGEGQFLAAIVPLSSACLIGFTTAALREPCGVGGVTGEVDQASLQKTTHRTRGQVEFSLCLIPSTLAHSLDCSRYS